MNPVIFFIDEKQLNSTDLPLIMARMKEVTSDVTFITVNESACDNMANIVADGKYGYNALVLNKLLKSLSKEHFQGLNVNVIAGPLKNNGITLKAICESVSDLDCNSLMK